VVHDVKHLGQLIKTMSKEYAEAVGQWRRFLSSSTCPDVFEVVRSASQPLPEDRLREFDIPS